jgi:hypothetical protein
MNNSILIFVMFSTLYFNVKENNSCGKNDFSNTIFENRFQVYLSFNSFPKTDTIPNSINTIQTLDTIIDTKKDSLNIALQTIIDSQFPNKKIFKPKVF